MMGKDVTRDSSESPLIIVQCLCFYRRHAISTAFRLFHLTKNVPYRSIYDVECSKYMKFYKNLLQSHENMRFHKLANFLQRIVSQYR